MNKIITMFIQGIEYNRMIKWNSVEEFSNALKNNIDLPKPNAIVAEAYIDDNLVDLGNTFEETVNKLKLILGIE